MLARPKKNSSREPARNFFRRHFQNIAFWLAEIAFPRDIFWNICFHTAEMFQNILNCGGVEKAYLSTEEEKYLQTCK